MSRKKARGEAQRSICHRKLLIYQPSPHASGQLCQLSPSPPRLTATHSARANAVFSRAYRSQGTRRKPQFLSALRHRWPRSGTPLFIVASHLGFYSDCIGTTLRRLPVGQSSCASNAEAAFLCKDHEGARSRGHMRKPRELSGKMKTRQGRRSNHIRCEYSWVAGFG